MLELAAAFQKNCRPDFTAADCVHLVPIELPDYFKKWIIGFKNNKIGSGVRIPVLIEKTTKYQMGANFEVETMQLWAAHDPWHHPDEDS